MIRAILLLVFYFAPLSAFTVKDKLIQGQVGDFVVTEQLKTYSILSIHGLTESELTLEEISIPVSDMAKLGWKEWIKKGAPGHTSWVRFTFDLKKNKLIKSYSLAKDAWLYPEDSEYFLIRLLSLPLSKTPLNQRTRIGPAPASGESDTRSVWNPIIVHEGKKIEKAKAEAWQTRWPKDESPLSQCTIEIYYYSNFALPYFVEIKTPHYAFKIRTVDSGSNL